MNNTSKAAIKTKQEAEIIQIKNEIKSLHIKKNIISKNLYILYNDAVKQYGKNWIVIENQTHNKIKPIMDLKYNAINKK
jgi:hypothetical protein